ncbi:hypothetical protein [Xanthobacter pseudotagetidis]|uniref:hypothetical protein n=1 Tax=Xanthobacter pseudotagetidis TaxID=3119911 RepID=UPI003727C061
MHARTLIATAFALALGAGNAAYAAAPFECPTKPLEAAQAAKIKALLPTGDAFDKIDQLNAAVTTLKAEGANPVLVIDNLIAAYCPVVASQSGLTDAQKSSRVSRFAARITRTVFAIDGTDEIILDVGFPPSVVDAINAKARAAGVSPEAWIQGTVASALK